MHVFLSSVPKFYMNNIIRSILLHSNDVIHNKIPPFYKLIFQLVVRLDMFVLNGLWVHDLTVTLLGALEHQGIQRIQSQHFYADHEEKME